jgi:hypothetical protein
MAAKPKTTLQAVRITEQVPSIQGGLSGMASANAPLIFFDEIHAAGHYNGIVHITLEALRFTGVGGGMVNDRVVTAHLRMNVQALVALKQAVANIEQEIRKAANVTKH